MGEKFKDAKLNEESLKDVNGGISNDFGRCIKSDSEGKLKHEDRRLVPNKENEFVLPLPSIR